MNEKKREPARWIIARELRECSETVMVGEGESQKEHFITPLGTRGRRILFCGKITSDIAKYIIDHGVHAPTIYFPLIVPEAMMIEPTEDAGKSDMDYFCLLIEEALKKSNEELHELPMNLPISRADDVKAAKNLKLHW